MCCHNLKCGSIFCGGIAAAWDRGSEYRDMRNEPFDAKYWRGRAEEALAAAMQLDDRDARLMLLDMAGTYDQLAQRAQERHRDSEDSKMRHYPPRPL
jgi:hypothetical protein